MKTVDIFARKKLVMSAEVFPPKKSGTIEGVVRALRDIKDLNPDFVSITYGAGGDGADTTADVASIALDGFGLNVAAHMTAVNMTRSNLLSQLETLNRKGIDNVLALRGDVGVDSRFFEFHHANELCSFIKQVAPHINLIGACYPEKHPNARTIEEDIDNLKLKVDCGVKHLITQLFFDNNKFFEFMDKLCAAGINVPVEAGIMPIVNPSQVARCVNLSNSSIPENMQKWLDKNLSPSDFFEAGIDYANQQIDGLIAGGCQGIHLYTMNRGDTAKRIFNNFKSERE